MRNTTTTVVIAVGVVLAAVAAAPAQSQLVFDGPQSHPGCELQQPSGLVGSLITAMLNDDQYPDIATTCFPTDEVIVYLGLAGGGLSLPVGYPTVNAEPRAITAGDFDGDQRADLASGNATGGGVSILLNDGAGAFEVTQSLLLGNNVHNLEAADLDGDGCLDLVVTMGNSPPLLAVVLGNGDGTFQAPGFYTVGGDPQGIAVADFDGNDLLDVAIANHGPDDLTVLFNTGLGAPESILGDSRTILVEGLSLSIGAGDLDGDGDVDLVVGADQSSHLAWVLLNDGTGQFGTPDGYGVGFAKRLELGDLDGDGDLDVATVNPDGQVSFLLNDGGGILSDQLNIDVADALVDLAFADLDQDEDLDVVVYGPPQAIHVLTNRTCPADGDFDQTVGIGDFLLVLAQWGPCPPLCPGDVDNDGVVGINDFLLVLANWGPCK